jgi:lipoprotein-anchoring transpeptidase ErfK/SrfK
LGSKAVAQAAKTPRFPQETDDFYRIHGSNEPWTIGTQVSSGCIRMRNEDVIDLYARVKIGTKVVVI